MVDIKQYLDEYKSWIKADIATQSDAVFIKLPMFHFGFDEGIVVKVTENDGRLVLSDCHTTLDYLDYLGVELGEHRERLDKITSKYGLILDGNVFRMTVPGTDYCFFSRYLGYFIQALALIANIDL